MTVIVSVYTRTDQLRLVLEGLSGQTDDGFEVVVAEDHQLEAMARTVEGFRGGFGHRLIHVSQPHDGFGKTRILNAALRASHHPYVVFLDGDCVPHPGLVAAYRRAATPGQALVGRRVMLGPAFTESVLSGRARMPPSLLRLLRSDSKRIEEALRIPFSAKGGRPRGIWGCNWGVNRSDLESINGYDEDFRTAGVGEDVDVEWRLLATGVTLASVKHRAVVYHLHHPANYSRDDVAVGREILRRKREAAQVRCVNGLARRPAGPAGGDEERRES